MVEFLVVATAALEPGSVPYNWYVKYFCASSMASAEAVLQATTNFIFLDIKNLKIEKMLITVSI